MAEVAGFYWKLTMKDGEEILIPSQHAEEIKRQLKTQAHIVTAEWTKNSRDVKSFEATTQPIETVAVTAEEIAQAFKEPMYTAEGAILCRWVKRTVGRREWNSFYSKLAGYRKLAGEEMAWRQPIHLLNTKTMTTLTADEIMTLGLTN